MSAKATNGLKVPTRRDIEAWRQTAQDADSLGVVKPGQFDWPWVVLSLIAEWEKNNADLLTTPLPDRPVRPAR